MPRKAFVVQVIDDLESPRGIKFKEIYDYLLVPALESIGFEAEKAHEWRSSQKISKRIVSQLRSAELVIVDITDLNPNVMWELGVRHALRPSGTVMVRDREAGEQRIPFDVGDYFVATYDNSPRGLSVFTQDLKTVVLEGAIPDLNGQEALSIDSPVFDALPDLHRPDESSRLVQVEQDLAATQSQLQGAELDLGRYRELYGHLTASSESDGVNIRLLREVARDFESGTTLAALTKQVLDAAGAGDEAAFAESAADLLEKHVDSVSEAVFLAMVRVLRGRLNLPVEARLVISGAAKKRFPENTYFASADLRDRISQQPRIVDELETGRPLAQVWPAPLIEAAELLAIDVTGPTASIDRTRLEAARRGWDDEDLERVALMALDWLYQSGLHPYCIELSESASLEWPEGPFARNAGRAYSGTGQTDMAIKWIRHGIVRTNPSPSDAAWLASVLESVQSPDIQVLEALALAASLHDLGRKYWPGLVFKAIRVCFDDDTPEQLATAIRDQMWKYADAGSRPDMDADDRVALASALIVFLRRVDSSGVDLPDETAELAPLIERLAQATAGDRFDQDAFETESALICTSSQARCNLAESLYDLIKTDLTLVDPLAVPSA